MAIESGTFGKIKVDGKMIALLKTSGLNLTTNMIDISTKDSLGWKENKPGQLSFKMDVEGLFAQVLQNLLVYTDDLTNAAWTKDHASIAVTKNNADSPYGAHTAGLITWNAGTSLSQTVLAANFTAGDNLVFSFWAKGSGTVIANIDDSGPGATAPLVLSSTWQLVQVPYTYISGNVISAIQKGSGTAVTVWGPMLEKATAASLYKPYGMLFADLLELQRTNTSFQVIFTNEESGTTQFRSDTAYISEESLKAGNEDSMSFTCSIEGSGTLIPETFS